MTGEEALLAITLAAAMLGLPVCARHAALALEEPPEQVARLARKWGALALVWLVFTAALGACSLTPGRLLWFTASASVATVISASSSFGARIARGLSPRWFIGFQSFRIVTALLVPTARFDLAAGFVALVIGVVPTGPRMRRIATLSFTALGLVTLAVTIVLSARGAGFGRYPLCQVALVGLPAALFGHVVALRWWWAGRVRFRDPPAVSAGHSGGNGGDARR